MSNRPNEEYIGLEEGWERVYETGVKPFLERVERGMDSEEFERQSIRAEVFIQVYDVVFRMCIQREPENWSEQVYQRYVQSIEAYLQEHAIPSLTEEKKRHDIAFLRELCLRWQRHQMVVKGLQKMFMYLDRFYVINNEDILPLAKKGFKVFHELLYSKFKAHARKCLLTAIHREREGEGQDKDLLASAVKVFVDLSFKLDSKIVMYETDFQKYLLSSSRDYYKSKSRLWMDEDSCPEYLKKAETALEQEQGRVQNYLHQSSNVPLMEACRDEILRFHENELLAKSSGIDSMLQQEQLEDLSRLFRLYDRLEGGNEPIAEAFKVHVRQLGFQLIADSKAKRTQAIKNKENVNEHELITSLIDLHERFQNIVHKAFQKHQMYEKMLKSAFEEFINKELYVSNLLARFIDAVLVSSSKVQIDDLEKTLDHVVVLYGYIRDKDLFEEKYQAFLAQRLLLGTSTSRQAEKNMIAKLKAECGYQWAAKLETMFKDVQFSEELSNEFSSFSGIGFEQELDVVVCQSGSWPSSVVVPVAVPEELQEVSEKYRNFYLSKYSGRKLNWAMHQGVAEINVVFDPEQRRGKLLIVSTFQMIILLLFNRQKIWSFKEIAETSQIPQKDLIPHILSLAHPSMKILKKNPNKKEIHPDDKFMLNKQFQKKAFRVKVPVMKIGNAGDDEEISKQIKIQRNHQIDAAIVRIMKTRQRLGHSQLVAEVLKHLQRFEPSGDQVKKRIETLIEQEYLERDTNDR